ncbi:hypothetical protein BDW74DRAFT_143555 [Aspergillus multicolor]|uniref:uncharacterized protein n=1 Tax=Aspergillus multicolor TaxID=41759 RepID=UPI003CCD3697
MARWVVDRYPSSPKISAARKVKSEPRSCNASTTTPTLARLKARVVCGPVCRSKINLSLELNCT